MAGVRRIALGGSLSYLAPLTTTTHFVASQGKHEDAKALLEQLLAIRIRVLGPDHPDVSRCREDLAQVLKSQVRVDFGSVECYHNRCYDVQSVVHRYPHSNIQRSCHYAGQVRRAQKSLCERLLAML